MVDFARPDHIDNQSEASSYYPRYFEDVETYQEYHHLPRSSSQPSLVRSLSQPSLARSASEFTERWIAPVRYDTASEFTSPETTPKSTRSTRMQQSLATRQLPGEPITAVERNTAWQQFSSSRQPGQSQIVTQEYVNESSTNFQTKRGWFGNN